MSFQRELLGGAIQLVQLSPDDCNDEKLCKWLKLLWHITLLLGMSVKRSFGQALVLSMFVQNINQEYGIHFSTDMHFFHCAHTA